MISIWFLQCLGSGFIGLLFLSLWRTGRRGRNYPPGPPTLPVIGNLHQLPKSGAYLKFTEWAHQYGGIFSLKMGSGTAVVLTDRSLVKDLLDKKSAISSDRPVSYVSDLITRGDHLLVMAYGDRWRSFRKLIHNHFNENRCEKEHIKLQNAEAVQMLRDFCMAPGDLMKHPKRFTNSIIMSLAFGIRSASTDTSHLVDLYKIMEGLAEVLEIGATPPVDIFPILKWVPERFFGNWITRARAVGRAQDALFGRMTARVKQRRLQVGSRGSFLDGVLDQQEKLGLNPNELNYLGGVMMEGGSDTVATTLLVFIQAMIKFPHVQKKAQVEIDSVVGEDRSPLWSDYARLPYVSQIVKETIRWRPVGPLAIAHVLRNEDTVNGMTLPKGAMITLNIWGLHHDPIRFPNPDVFDPDRFAGRTLLAPEYANAADFENRDHYGYGAGRRICPGIHLAERSLFLGMAKLLWGFEFSESKDDRGNAISLDVDVKTAYKDGFSIGPKPFEAEIRPRSGDRRATIMREFDQAERDVFSHHDL